MTSQVSLVGNDEIIRTFPRPIWFSSILWQTMWIPFGVRFNCFTIAGIKRG